MYVLGIQNAPQTRSPVAQAVAFPVARERRECSDQADTRSGKAAKKIKVRISISLFEVAKKLVRRLCGDTRSGFESGCICERPALRMDGGK